MKSIRARHACCLALLLLAVCALPACEVSLPRPLSDAREAKPDERLLGKWLSRDDEKNGHIQFDRGAGAEMTISMFGPRGGERNPVFKMFTTTLGGRSYMNLRLADDMEGTDCLPARYEVAGDELTVWLLDPKKVKEAIAHGKLKGEDGMYGAVLITDTPARVKTLLTSPGGDALFEVFGKFSRVTK